MKCRKCGCLKSTKNGFRNGKQCFKCKECGFQFTTEKSPGIPKEVRHKAISLYILGQSMRSIAKLFKVSPNTILRWVRIFALKNYEKPVPIGPVAVELDEMWHFIGSKKRSSGSGKPTAATLNSLLTGSAEQEIAKHSEKC